MTKNRTQKLVDRQREFQLGLGWPIDSVDENDRNELSEKYVFKAIEELVELRREFPSIMNPWSKHQKIASMNRIKEEFSDVILFLINISLVWRISLEELLGTLESVQENNFKKIKEKKMAILNSDILKIPNRVSGVGQGNLSPKYVFVGQNPGKNITKGYKFWSELEGSSKVLLTVLEELSVIDNSYFTNLVKCTTPENKEPSDETAEFYMEFLKRELDVLKFGNPDMKVIAMGEWTASHLKEADSKIPHPASVLHGKDLTDYKQSVNKLLTRI